ncbi:MAG: hypothetical protein ABI175_17045 [Polyangiales bacterium]
MDAPPTPTCTVFLLSPAKTRGLRAEMLLSERASFDLARRLRAAEGAPIGEVFAWLSALYFRGKLAYARRFADPPSGLPGAFAIVPGLGLRPVDEPFTAARLRLVSGVDASLDDERHVKALLRDAQLLARTYVGARFVLLGSIATDKYVGPLLEAMGERLVFPSDFVGRGDMSRGGLLLRASRAGRELPYAVIASSRRSGPRVPKLPRLRR